RCGQGQVDRLLVGDADRDLERVEAAALGRVAGRLAVTAVADVPRPAPLASLLEGGDGVAFPEVGQRAGVELDQVEVVGPEAAEAPLDAGEERGRSPVSAPPAAGVPALREEVDVPAPGAERPSDERLAVLVALGGVDRVEPRVERAPQESPDRPVAGALVA